MCLRLIYPFGEKFREKGSRKSRQNGGGREGEGKGKGGRRGGEGREKLYAGRRRDELQLRILRITILLTSFSLLRGTGRNGFRLLVGRRLGSRPLRLLDSSWMLLLRWCSARPGRNLLSLSLSLTDQTVRSEKLKRKKKKWREPAISENSWSHRVASRGRNDWIWAPLWTGQIEKKK